MTTNRNARQEIPLRPLFYSSVAGALSPVDKPRRVTLPAQLPPHLKSTTYNNRIKKHRANSHKRRGGESPELDQQFADAIEDTRKEIREAVDQVLTKVEGDANVELAQVVAEFEEKLQLALEYETQAFQSIAEERLLITTLSPVVRRQEVIFGDRMQVFQHICEEEEKALESLWQEWTEIQARTIYLAIEILGPHEVVVEEKETSVIAPEKVDGAIQCYVKHQDTLKDTLDTMADIQTSARKVTSRTLKTLKDQQEELSAANKATMKNMARMLEELNR